MTPAAPPGCTSDIPESLNDIAEELINAPQVFLSAVPHEGAVSLDARIKDVTKALFSCLGRSPCIKKLNDSVNARNSLRRFSSRRKTPSVLHVSGIDTDQLWVQIDDAVAPIVEDLKGCVLTFNSSHEGGNKEFSFINEGCEERTTGDMSAASDSVSSDWDAEDEEEQCGKSELSEVQALQDEDRLSTHDGYNEDDSSENDEEQNSAPESSPKDDLFDLDDMNRFVDEGEKEAQASRRLKKVDNAEKMRESDNDEDTDEEELERLLCGYEDDLRKRKAGSADDSETGETDEEKDEDEEGEGCSDEEDLQSGEMDEDTEMVSCPELLQNGDRTHGGCKSNMQENGASKSSLLALAEKNDELNALLDATERELISEKHWSLMGEASAKHRDKNSLLELHLELPQYHHQYATDSELLPDTLGVSGVVDEEDVQQATGSLSASDGAILSRLSATIEALVKQRIKYSMFDDVERKYSVQPAAKSTLQQDDAVAETLDFKKSRVGLADVYAEEYTKEILGGVSAADVETDKKRLALTHLFATIMYKLDALSHQRTLQKPQKEKSSTPDDVAAITVEDTIPAIVSEAQRKAPEEILAPEAEKQREEMTQEEKRALRQSNKARRKNKQRQMLLSGEMTLRDTIQRNLHLKDKNRKNKENKEHMRRTGLTSMAQRSKILGKSGRVRANELLAEVTDRERLQLT